MFLSRLLESPYGWELEASQTTQKELSHLISSGHPNTKLLALPSLTWNLSTMNTFIWNSWAQAIFLCS